MPKLRFGTKAVIITAVLFALTVGTAWAQHRPNPLMDYAPQETGIYDTYYDYLMEADCRYCHGNSLADRHHFNEGGSACTTCHKIGPPPDYGYIKYSDCRYNGGDVACHYDFSNGWHHNTTLADSDQCTACHNPQILGELTEFQDPTLYPPTVVTPTPFSCENCHWEQLADTVTGRIHPSTDIHYDPWGSKVANLVQFAGAFAVQGGELQMIPNADGWKYSCDEQGNDRPVGWEKDILDNMATHHMNWQGTVVTKCYNCHANDPGDPSWDPNNPILIRYCERCHDIASLHRIAGHVDNVEIWNGFMYGNNAKAWEAAELNGYADARIYRTFSANERCIGCHGDGLASYDPPYSCGEPAITGIEPDAGEPGAVVAISGSNFGEDWTEGCAITLTPVLGGTPVSVPVSYWTDTEVGFRLPAWLFPTGNYHVHVTAWAFDASCTTLSLQTTTQVVVFSVVDHPTLTGIGTDVNPYTDCADDYAYGPFYSVVDLCGSGGFEGGNDDGNPATGSTKTAGTTNIFSQVVLTASAGSPPGGGPAGSLVVADSSQWWNAGTKNSINSWSDTAIQFQLLWVWRDDNGNYLQDAGEAAYIAPDFLQPGDYAVRVRSIYWIDKGDGLGGAPDGKPQQPDLTDPTNPLNEYTQVCVSDPVTLNLTNDPQIWKVKPKKVTQGLAAAIIGANFGPMQEDSVVKIYKPDMSVAATLSLGDARIRLWSNTKIKFKTKSMGKGVRYAKVTVGGIDSGLRKFRII